jgi:hypothetical protein
MDFRENDFLSIKTYYLKNILRILFVMLSVQSYAQTVRQPLAASYPAMGAYSKKASDIFSTIVNPAALANLKQAGAGVYSERRFLLNAFSQYTAVAGFQTSSGAFAAQADYFGYAGFNETQISLAYARSLGSKMDMGARFHYYNLRIPSYASAVAFLTEIGVLLHLTEKLHAGFSVYNPLGGELNRRRNEKIASVYRTGFGYELSDHFFISAEMIKEENKDAGVNVVFQYQLVNDFFLRAGVNTVSKQPFAGVGLKVGNYRVDIATSFHPQLGISPGLMFLFDLKGKTKNIE